MARMLGSGLLLAGAVLCATLWVQRGMAAQGGPAASMDAKLPDAPAFGAPPLGSGVLLVASRELQDPNFSRSVVLMVDHGPGGALGLIINRPTDLNLAHLLPEAVRDGARVAPVYMGGPVARERIMLLVQAVEPLAESRPVLDGLYLSASMATLDALIAEDGDAPPYHAYAGYAGWAPGQLEAEISRGDWHIAAGSADAVFTGAPERLWPDLIRQSAGHWVRDVPATRRDNRASLPVLLPRVL